LPTASSASKATFSRFLEEKQAYLESQSKQQESLRNQVKTEIEWLRRGPKARTTKSKARIDTANAMIGQLKAMDSRTTSTPPASTLKPASAKPSASSSSKMCQPATSPNLLRTLVPRSL
jgi:ATPase subunit of ABC transporter with duplicated ATPase domains